jgi:putative membrane protein
MRTLLSRFMVAIAFVLTLSLLGFGQGTQGSATGSASGATATGADTGGKHQDKDMDQHKSSKSGSFEMNSSAAKVSSADRSFITKAAEGGLAEVELGQLAQEKAKDSKIKDFGKRMVDDHGKANDQLKSLASSKGVNLPSDLNAKDKAEKDRLSKLSGEQFDKAYMSLMVKDHTKDVSEFRRESQSAKDPEVKNFASSTLPTLEEHLKIAKSIAPQQSASASSDKSMRSSEKSMKTKGSSTSASNPPQQ